jgi:hypothetical protein
MRVERAGGGSSPVFRAMPDWLSPQALCTENPSSPIVVVGQRATWYAFDHLLRGGSPREAIVESWAWQPGWNYALYGLPSAFVADPFD